MPEKKAGFGEPPPDTPKAPGPWRPLGGPWRPLEAPGDPGPPEAPAGP